MTLTLKSLANNGGTIQESSEYTEYHYTIYKLFNPLLLEFKSSSKAALNVYVAQIEISKCLQNRKFPSKPTMYLSNQKDQLFFLFFLLAPIQGSS